MKKHKRQEFSTVALPTFFVRSNNVRAFQKKKLIQMATKQ